MAKKRATGKVVPAKPRRVQSQRGTRRLVARHQNGAQDRVVRAVSTRG